MSDLIDRQVAIAAVRKEMYADKDYMSAIICDGIEDVLNSLPSAQPEIIHCKDCKWSDVSSMGHLAVCNHSRGLVNASPYSYCNFAERRTDERSDKQTGSD